MDVILILSNSLVRVKEIVQVKCSSQPQEFLSISLFLSLVMTGLVGPASEALHLGFSTHWL